MARQKLIHLHSASATTSFESLKTMLELGEIAVAHNPAAPKLLIRVTGESKNEIVEFIDKTAIEAYEINGKVLGSTPVLNGADIKLNGYTKAATTSAITADDTINVALGKLEKGLEDVGGDAIVEIEAGDGISVSEKADHKQTVSAKVATVTEGGEQWLKVDGDGLKVDGIKTYVANEIGKLDVTGNTSPASHGVAITVDETDGKVITPIVTVTPGSVAEENGSLVTGGAVYAHVKAEIEKLDVTDVAVDGMYVSQVSETDGKVDVVRTEIPVMGVKEGEKVVSLDTNRKIQTTLVIGYNSENRKVQLKGIDDVVVSEFDASAFIKDGMLYGQAVFTASATTQEVTIKQQKHAFSGLTTGNTYLAMCFSNGEATGTTYSWDKIDVTSLIDVYTAGDGLKLEDGKFSVKLDNQNEDEFLTVGEDGLKLAGVRTTIDMAYSNATAYTSSAITALDATVGDTTIANGKHVAVQVVETDGKLTSLTVSESDIASATGLTAETNRATSAETALGDRLNVIEGEEAVVGSIKKALKDAKNYTDNKITGLDATASGETTHITVKVDEKAGKITGVTVTETNIASADSLANEITARKTVDGISGDTYSATTAATYISGATSLNDADQKLDAALNILDSTAVKSVGIETGKDSGVTVSGGQNPKFDFSALVINCGEF